jgi:hypothetical protein
MSWEQAHPDGPREVLEQAWEEIYRAEGSDWFWWYSSRNSAPEERLFDALFRARLKAVYRLLGETPPASLFLEAFAEDGARPAIPLLAQPAAEWPSAAFWEHALTVVPAAASLGATQRASTPIRHLRACCDHEQLHLRVETCEPLDGQSLIVEIWPDSDTEREPWSIHLPGGEMRGAESGVMARRDTDWAALAIPLAALSAHRPAQISMRVSLVHPNGERCWVPSECPVPFLLISPSR